MSAHTATPEQIRDRWIRLACWHIADDVSSMDATWVIPNERTATKDYDIPGLGAPVKFRKIAYSNRHDPPTIVYSVVGPEGHDWPLIRPYVAFPGGNLTANRLALHAALQLIAKYPFTYTFDY